MITLILVRHAKSDWGTGQDDHERPLNDRGRRDAPVMARRLAATGVRPARILSSTAVRARTTAQAFAGALGLEVETDEGLYGAPGSRLLATAAASGVTDVLVVAHDPGMTVLAEQLSDGGIGEMPTCAVATFTWDTDDWDVATSVPPARWSVDTPRDVSAD
ncbi:phosphohistidine phosphatase [Microbacterium sp. LKL04]|uniref:SixA phosphatase family protein n=1 Tax=unclassified Microbacterium TaxID=2609290 RepID=UPI000875EE67|nr:MULTISPECIES: histidine phosphatase family protein [unclassified Microbacterium]MDQ1127852.1 phosphohistidine phosphatase [Microbacterium sp. SORGH_AS_0505]SCY32733.1 phosphohistidine phosphatase [Microbacterium sp. LKL04]